MLLLYYMILSVPESSTTFSVSYDFVTVTCDVTSPFIVIRQVYRQTSGKIRIRTEIG